MFTRRGRYSGRLAFDPDTGFHVSVNGRKVVTDDGGKTWRYAKRSDASHNARYQTRVAVIDSTSEDDPHHLKATADDLHVGGLLSDPDAVAATVTSHTEAYQ